jgi:hypothetical protein
MPLEPTAELRVAASELVGMLFAVARRDNPPAQEGIVTYSGDVDGVLEVTVNGGEPARVIARPIESLLVGDAVFVRRMNGYDWAPFLYESFGYRGDTVEGDPMRYQPRVAAGGGDPAIQFCVANNSPVRAGVVHQREVVSDLTITAVHLIADVPCSLVLDVERCVSAATLPVFASICGAHKPVMAGVQHLTADLTGWTTSLAPGNILRFRVEVADLVRVLAVVVV